MAMERSGYCPDGVYRSLFPPIQLPEEIHLDLVSFLLRNTQKHSSLTTKTAVVDATTGQYLTYSELEIRVSSVAAGLVSLGVNQGDVVLILSSNSIHFPVVFLAVIAIGAIITTVNPLYTWAEILKQIRDSHAKMIFTTPELLKKVEQAEVPVILIEEFESQKQTLRFSYWDLVNADPRGAAKPHIKQTDTAALLYSSGTTGTSKGVILTHRNIIAAALQISVTTQRFGITDETVLCMLPMFHVFGLVAVMYSHLLKGDTVVTMPKFEMELLLEAVQKYRVTFLPTVPPVWISLAKSKDLEKYNLSSLRHVLNGAAPLGKEIMEECAVRLPAVNLCQGYGLTESSSMASIYRGRLPKEHFGTTGLLASSMEAKIVDIESGNPLPATRQGEIWLRGPNIMQGYLNKEEETRHTIDNDRWLHTGDVGYFNADGFLFIADRLKELIKFKGFQIAPAELEALLLSNPSILDAAVVRSPDDEAGEVPHAFVVQSPEKRLSESDVIKFIAEQVAPFKKVRKVTFVSSIPKSASGKILRRHLMQQPAAKL